MSNIQTSNITFNDIRTLLNANGGAVTNNVSTAFTNGNINKWAKNKPTRLNIMFTDAWQNALGDCGLDWSAVKVSSVSALKALYDNGTTDWTYKAPRGGANEPYRLGDFRGYNPLAVPIVSDVYVRTPVYEGAKVHIEALSSQGGSDMVTLKDITALSEWCACAVIYRGSTYVGYCTSSNGTLEMSVDIDFSGMDFGTYTVYPCMAKAQKGFSDAEPVNEFIALPLTSQSFEYISNGGGAVTPTRKITLTAYRSDTEVSAYIDITASEAVTLENVYIEGRFTTDFSVMHSGEYQKQIGTINVPVSGYSSGKISIPDTDKKMTVVRLTSNNGATSVDMYTEIAEFNPIL